MKLETVLNRLRLLTEDSREELLLLLASDAVGVLSERVIGTAEEITEKEDALCATAAAYAAYQLALLDEAQSPDSVTAGDVRAEYKTGSIKARVYYEQCLRGLSGFLRDDAFYFGGVRA